MLTTLFPMLVSLVGGGLGGLLRYVPEIFKLFSDKGDRDHEYRMTELQLKIDQARATQAIDLVHAQSDAGEIKGQMDAYIEAIKGQEAPSGVPWADALSKTVRPVITYWWMSLLTIYKVVLTVAACVELYIAVKAISTLVGFKEALTVFSGRLWTPQDAGILSMIIGFWFVDRVIKKNNGQ